MARPGRPRKHSPVADEIRQAIEYSTIKETLGLIRKAKVDITDGEGRTPLIHAVFAGKNEIVSATLADGANINHQDRNGWTPLHFAVQEKRRELAEYLLGAYPRSHRADYE